MASRRAVAASLLFSLGAIACLSGPAPRDHYYRLEAQAPQPLASPRLSGVLEIDQPRAEALTNERLMLYRKHAGDPELQQHSYHRWADAPSRMIQAALVSYLRAGGAAKTVVTPDLRVPSDFVLRSRIVRLERDLDSRSVTLGLEVHLARAEGGGLLLQRTYLESHQAGGGDAGDAVTAFDQALTAALQRLLADLPSG